MQKFQMCRGGVGGLVWAAGRTSLLGTRLSGNMSFCDFAFHFALPSVRKTLRRKMN